MDHIRRGHEQICEEIHRGGNAEQYYADKKYKEAVAAAVEACAADRTSTRGTSAAGCASPFPKPPKRPSVLTKLVFRPHDREATPTGAQLFPSLSCNTLY